MEFKELKQLIVDKIKDIKWEDRITNKIIAERLNVKPPAISKIYTLKEGVTLDKLLRILDIVGYTIEIKFIKKSE